MSNWSDWIWSPEHQDYYRWTRDSSGNRGIQWGSTYTSRPRTSETATSSTIQKHPTSVTQSRYAPQRSSSYTLGSSSGDFSEAIPSQSNYNRTNSAPPAQPALSSRLRVEIYAQPSSHFAIALQDTGAESASWIMPSLIERLGRWHEVRECSPLSPETANGTITSNQEISIHLKREGGHTFYPCQLRVLPTDLDIGVDIVLGLPFIMKHNMVTMNRSALLPLLHGKSPSESEKAAMAAAEQRRRQEEAALKARREEAARRAAAQQNQYPNQQHYRP